MKKLAELLAKWFPGAFGTSPETTLWGYIVAILAIIQPIIQEDGFDIKKDWWNILFAVVAGLWGRRQKDSNGIPAAEGYQMKQDVEKIKEVVLIDGDAPVEAAPGVQVEQTAQRFAPVIAPAVIAPTEEPKKKAKARPKRAAAKKAR